MIEIIKGDIFSTSCYALVNPVNIVGVMGKGLALNFKIKYPDMYNEYKELCRKNKLNIGVLHFYKVNSSRIIINFPTKEHWKNPSKLSYISSGLNYFVNNYKLYDINSIAFPKIGCGFGNLNFEEEVYPLMNKILHHLNIIIKIYV